MVSSAGGGSYRDVPDAVVVVSQVIGVPSMIILDECSMSLWHGKGACSLHAHSMVMAGMPVHRMRR